MISKFFIERPVLANVLAIVIVLIGCVALYMLPVAQYPNVVPPTVSVSTSYPGASANTVVNTVALPIEQQVNGVQGMLYMQSTSASDGTYTLNVTFQIGTDLNFAQVLVQNRVSAAMASLPQAVQVQGVTVQQKSTSILQIVSLTATDPRFDSLYLSNYATINLVPELSRLLGVGNVNVFGVGQYSMRIWLDPQTLHARGLAPQDVINAIQQQSQQVTAGQIGAPPAPREPGFPIHVNVEGRLADPTEFGNIVVKVDTSNGGQITRVKDVARVELGAQTYSQASELNNRPSAGVAIFQLPNANALNVAALVDARMKELAKAFPQGLSYSIPFDTTVFVKTSITEVYKTLGEAAVLVLIVILVFLQDWRAMLVPATTVPVTIIGAFAAMWAFGFTVNLSTLFAIILAIGIVVDDAIVIVEGVSHHMERGLTPHDAAIKAMDELFGPIIGITLVLMSVFIPAAFLPGLTGQMYAQFALVIAATAIISAVNAATLKPTQCALWLRVPTPPEKRNIFFRGFNRVYDKCEGGYAWVISHMTHHAGIAVIAALIVGGIGVWGVASLPTAFIPVEDQGYVMINVQLPDGSAVGRTQAVLEKVTKLALATPGVDQVVSISGISVLDNSATLQNAGVAYVILKNWSERSKSAGTDLLGLYLRISAELDKMPEAIGLVLVPPPIQGIGNANGFTMQVEMRDGSFDYAKLQNLSRTIVNNGNSQSGLQRLSTTFRSERSAIGGLGRSREGRNIERAGGRCVQCAVGLHRFGVRAISSTSSAAPIRCYVQADSKYRLEQSDIEHLWVRSKSNQMVPLGTLVTIKHDVGPALVSLYNLYPTAAINGGAAQGFSSGEALNLMGQIADRTLPPGTGYRMDGDVVSGEGDRQSDRLCVRVRIAAGVSVPGGAGRKLDRAAVGPACRAAVADGAVRGAGQSGRGQQPVYADWTGTADRAVGEERDPDCRGCAREESVGRTDPGCARSTRHALGSGRF